MSKLKRFFGLKRILVMLSFISLPGHSKTSSIDPNEHLDVSNQDENYYVFQLDEEGRKKYRDEFGEMEV